MRKPNPVCRNFDGFYPTPSAIVPNPYEIYRKRRRTRLLFLCNALQTNILQRTFDRQSLWDYSNCRRKRSSNGASPAQIQLFASSAPEDSFCQLHALRQVPALCQPAGYGGGEGTSGPMGVGIFPPAGRETSAQIPRVLIKSSKSLENKGFIAMCLPYLFIRLHTSLLFPSLLIRANTRARKSHNKI